jgi:pimeloyl-ACP methyl ester carboxylesterase
MAAMRAVSAFRSPPGTRLALLVLPLAGLLAGCALGGSHGRHAVLRGIRMYYEVHGRGRALLLLHGGTGDGTQFAKQVPAFQGEYRVIVPDLRAQGRTTDGPGPLSYHVMAEDVVALLDRLHVRTTDIMGWSDGGIVGLDIAIHHPDRVRHLVTFGANFQPDGLLPEEVRWGATASAGDLGPAVRLEYQRMAPDPAHYEVAMNKILAMWRIEPRFTMDELHSIRARTLIAAGEHDLVRPDHSEALARAISGARLWIVPGASHGAMLEQPDLVNRTVLDFLAQRVPSGTLPWAR